MDNPSSRGLSVTFSWGALDDPKRRTVSLGAALRVALAASLVVAAYEVGRWQERVLAADAAPKPASAVVVVEKSDKTAKAEKGTGAAPGQAVGEPTDVITPLNVRDPSALVMGPSESSPPPAAAPAPQADVPEVAPPPRVYKKAKDIHPNPKVQPNQQF